MMKNMFNCLAVFSGMLYLFILIDGAFIHFPNANKPAMTEPCIVMTTASTVTKPGGLLVAIWPDGKALVRARPYDISAKLVIAECSEAEVKTALTMIDTSQFEECTDFALPPGATYIKISIRSPMKSPIDRRWDEQLSNLGSPSEYEKQFAVSVRAWFQARSAIWSIVPTSISGLDSQLDATGKFRGYSPERPYDVDWMH